MNQLVPFHSGQAPVLIAAAGERARVRFVEFFLRKAPRGRREQFRNHLVGNLQSVQQISAKLTGFGCLLQVGSCPLSGPRGFGQTLELLGQANCRF